MATVLVVDDDQSIREMLVIALDQHDVIEAGHGQEALAKLSDERIDLVLLDVMMPTLDGIETLRRLRVDPRHRDLPVAIITAKVGEDDHLRGFQAGADAYITKPFDPAEITDTIEQLLRRTPDERRRIREAEREKAALLRQVERRFR
jgi:DNA-binding response OmpR family regulator